MNTYSIEHSHPEIPSPVVVQSDSISNMLTVLWAEYKILEDEIINIKVN